MRNLKRVLSLTLATAMLFGMMVMGASAADKKPLTDLDKVTNKEAVNLMVDLGIVEGKTDGSFAPAETVNRATMAKLITVMMMGDVDPSAFAGTSTDLTDVDGHWAEGYIKYCYSNKIISGNGAGKFLPDEPVTTVAAAKMLLVAIGYEAEDRGYENDANWSVNIMKDAQSTKLDDGKTVRALTKGLSVKATDPLSRDNAAQMIFNTLFVATQKPSYQWDGGKQYIQEYKPELSLADTTYNGVKPLEGILENVKLVNKVAKATINDGTTSSDVDVSASPSDIGSKVIYYVDSAGKVISTTVSTSGSQKVLTTVTNGTAIAKLTQTANTDKKYIGFEPETTPTILVNGAKKTWNTDVATTLGTTYDKVGTKIEFIDTNDNNKYDIVKVTTYTLSKVTGTTAAKGDTKATVTIASLGAVTNLTKAANIVETDKIEGVSDLKKDDIILYNIVGNVTDANSVAKIVIATPETVDGKITGKASDNKSVTIDGTKYTASEVVATGASLDKAVSAVDIASIMKAFVDANGYVIGFNTITEGTANNYALVLDATWTAPSINNDYKGSLTGLFLLSDGTRQPYTVKTVGSDAAVESDKDIKNTVISYSVNSDGLLLIEKQNDSNKVSNTGATTITKGAATVTVGSTTAYANDKTVYFYCTGTLGENDFKTSSFVGRANAPTYSTSDASKITLIHDGDATTKTAIAVIIGDSVAAAGTGEYAYLLEDSTYETVEGGKLYSVVMDGEKTTLLLEGSGTFTSDTSENKLYPVSTNSDDTKVFGSTTAYTATFKSGDVKLLADGTVVVDGAGAGEYAMDEDVYTYVTASTTADSVLSVGDTISYLYSTSGNVNTITHIFITTDT